MYYFCTFLLYFDLFEIIEFPIVVMKLSDRSKAVSPVGENSISRGL